MCRLRNWISAFLAIISVALFALTCVLTWHAVDEKPLVLKETVISVGKAVAKEESLVQVTMRNRGPDPVRILGNNGRCSLHGCFHATNLPLEISAGESKVIDVSFQAGNKTGAFVYRLTFYTDAPKQSEVTVDFRGVVVRRDGGPPAGAE